MMHLTFTTAPQKQALFFRRSLLNFCFPPVAARFHAPAVRGRSLEHGEYLRGADISSEMRVNFKHFYLVATSATTPLPAMGDSAGVSRVGSIPELWSARCGSDRAVALDGKAASNLANRFQNFVMPFFSKNLCFTTVCH